MIRIILGALFVAMLTLSLPQGASAGPAESQKKLEYDP